MSRIDCYTSASFSYLDRARVLAESVRQHHPDWRIHLTLCDEVPAGFAWDADRDAFDSVVPSSELGIAQYRSWTFGHNVVEFCTAVKGFMMDRLLESGPDAVVYLDPDIALFSPLVDVETLLERHSVVLTPHVTTAETTDEGVLDNEVGSLKHGTYNLGFVAVRNDASGRAFARWWRDRLHKWCWDDIANGLFVDQRWCDLVPALFDGVTILREAGYNTASWNLSHQPITIGHDGVIRAADRPLRFFHFTKVNTVGMQMLRRYAYGETGVFELLRHYRQRLAVHHADGLPDRYWAYAQYSDGHAIAQTDRIIWRTRPDLRQAFSDPFLSGPGSFQIWCQQQ